MVSIRSTKAGQTCTESSLIDAVPKKRGPKTDVLEALLKRVDGLERRLKEEKKPHSPSNESGPSAQEDSLNCDTVPQPPTQYGYLKHCRRVSSVLAHPYKVSK